MMADTDEEIGGRGEDEMLMDASPRTAFEVIESQVILSSEEVL